LTIIINLLIIILVRGEEMKKYRWEIPSWDEEWLKVIEKKISPLLAQTLWARGIHNWIEIEELLYQNNKYYDPLLFQDMDKSVERIYQAIIQNEKILIYGDYDADGVTSTALLFLVLRKLEANVDYYIPNRFLEGYGLNREAIEWAKKNNFQLIITVDTGISAVEEINFANSLNIDVIITDHHEPPTILPKALAIINPKLSNCTYPFRHLAGVGVTWKLAHSLLGRLPLEYLSLVIIGTIADIVPLTGENRVIVKNGLTNFRDNLAEQFAGIKALLESAGINEKEITTNTISFLIAPRINAGGRLDTANLAVKLLLSKSLTEANHLARELEELNHERQRIVDEIFNEVIEKITEDDLNSPVLIIAGENWNTGVIGIVASRVLERFYLPVIILSIDPATNMAKGSARSIESFNIYEALNSTRDLLDHFGGHKAACGLTIKTDNILELKERLKTYAENNLTPDDYIPIIRIDAKATLREVNIDNIKELQQLAPFGIGNSKPKILIENVSVTNIYHIGKNKEHLKLTLEQEGVSLEALWFRNNSSSLIGATFLANVVGQLELNNWNNIITPQIIIDDMEIISYIIYDKRNLTFKNETKYAEDLSDYLSFSFRKNNLTKESLNQVKHLLVSDLPTKSADFKDILEEFRTLQYITLSFSETDLPKKLTRQDLAFVYTKLKKLNKITISELTNYFSDFNNEELKFIIDVFRELNFLSFDEGEQKFFVKDNVEKNSLNNSKLYQEYLLEYQQLTWFLTAPIIEICRWLNAK